MNRRRDVQLGESLGPSSNVREIERQYRCPPGAGRIGQRERQCLVRGAERAENWAERDVAHALQAQSARPRQDIDVPEATARSIRECECRIQLEAAVW